MSINHFAGTPTVGTVWSHLGKYASEKAVQYLKWAKNMKSGQFTSTTEKNIIEWGYDIKRCIVAEVNSKYDVILSIYHPHCSLLHGTIYLYQGISIYRDSLIYTLIRINHCRSTIDRLWTQKCACKILFENCCFHVMINIWDFLTFLTEPILSKIIGIFCILSNMKVMTTSPLGYRRLTSTVCGNFQRFYSEPNIAFLNTVGMLRN